MTSLYLTLYHLHAFIRKLRLAGPSPCIATAVAAHPCQVPDFVAEAFVDAPIATMVEGHAPPFWTLNWPRLSCRRRSSCHCTRKQLSHVLIVNRNVDRPGRLPRRPSGNGSRGRRRRRRHVEVLQLRQNGRVLRLIPRGILNACFNAHCHWGRPKTVITRTTQLARTVSTMARVSVPASRPASRKMRVEPWMRRETCRDRGLGFRRWNRHRTTDCLFHLVSRIIRKHSAILNVWHRRNFVISVAVFRVSHGSWSCWQPNWHAGPG